VCHECGTIFHKPTEKSVDQGLIMTAKFFGAVGLAVLGTMSEAAANSIFTLPPATYGGSVEFGATASEGQNSYGGQSTVPFVGPSYQGAPTSVYLPPLVVGQQSVLAGSSNGTVVTTFSSPNPIPGQSLDVGLKATAGMSVSAQNTINQTGAAGLNINVTFKYYFEILGPSGYVPTTIIGNAFAGTPPVTGFGSGLESSSASVSLNGFPLASVFGQSDEPNHANGLSSFAAPNDLQVNTIYQISMALNLSGQLSAESLNGAVASDVNWTAYIDPAIVLNVNNPQDYTFAFSSNLAPTPLPSTWLMLFGGLAGLGFLAHRGSKNGSTAFAAA
jgi:hypothetical protein